VKYVNLTHTTKTFYDVEFKPGDVKDVPGCINADGFYRTDTDETSDVDLVSQTSEQVVEVTEEPKTSRSRKSKTSETEGE
jgi:hypothetical protein